MISQQFDYARQNVRSLGTGVVVYVVLWRAGYCKTPHIPTTLIPRGRDNRTTGTGMCGIAILNLDQAPVNQADLAQMLAVIRHRRRNGTSMYRDAWAGLGNVRLSIIDISGGVDRLEMKTALYGLSSTAIFNMLAAPGLKNAGTSRTNCDTEVVLPVRI
jgi:hypothetical protein